MEAQLRARPSMTAAGLALLAAFQVDGDAWRAAIPGRLDEQAARVPSLRQDRPLPARLARRLSDGTSLR